MDWAAANVHWVWLIFGIILMTLEIFGASGYLLVTGLAAGFVALVSYVAPGIELKWQLLLFGVALVILGTVVTVWFRKHDKSSQNIDVGQPGSDLLGKTFTLSAPVENYETRMRIQDANWDVSATVEVIPVGARIRVVDVKGRTLIVEPV